LAKVNMESVSLPSNESTPSHSTQQEMLIDARLFYQHDPLFMLLKKHWQLHDGWVLLGGGMLPTIAFAAWGIWLGFVPPLRHLWTFDNTLSAFLQVFLVFPILFLIYLNLPDWLTNLFNQLHTRQIIGTRRSNSPGPKTYHEAVQLLRIWMGKWWWSAGAIVLMVLYISYRIPVVEIPYPTSVPLWLRCLDLAAFAPLIYATILCIIRIVVIFVALNWLLWHFSVQIRPLSPDGTGGLGMLTKLMWLSMVMLLWDALLLYAGLLSRNVNVFSSLELSLLGIIYIALVPLVLLGWTLLPHLAMVKARDSYLQPLADELYQLLTQNSHSTHVDTETMKATTDRLNELERRLSFVRTTFPTWPIELQAFGRLVVALILPPLIAVIVPRLLP
jgi:hypothetical protein